jgi:hypothetical protein
VGLEDVSGAAGVVGAVRHKVEGFAASEADCEPPLGSCTQLLVEVGLLGARIAALPCPPQAIDRYCKVTYGYGAHPDVRDPNRTPDDRMER